MRTEDTEDIVKTEDTDDTVWTEDTEDTVKTEDTVRTEDKGDTVRTECLLSCAGDRIRSGGVSVVLDLWGSGVLSIQTPEILKLNR